MRTEILLPLTDTLASGAIGRPLFAHAPTALLPLDTAEQLALIDSARDPRSIEGLTHRHYHYPARFSPLLVGRAIETFTAPGDLVLDPYLGGGTTLVEAYARGREAIGSDISTLASFVSKTKLLTLTAARAKAFLKLVAEIGNAINIHRPEPKFEDWAQLGYFRNLDSPTHWRLRKVIAQAVDAIEVINDPSFESLARCAVLRNDG